jgi:hypothetical protein
MVSIVNTTYGRGRVTASYNELIVVAHVVDWLWACDVELIKIQPESSAKNILMTGNHEYVNNNGIPHLAL